MWNSNTMLLNYEETSIIEHTTTFLALQQCFSYSVLLWNASPKKIHQKHRNEKLVTDEEIILCLSKYDSIERRNDDSLYEQASLVRKQTNKRVNSGVMKRKKRSSYSIAKLRKVKIKLREKKTSKQHESLFARSRKLRWAEGNLEKLTASKLLKIHMALMLQPSGMASSPRRILNNYRFRECLEGWMRTTGKRCCLLVLELANSFIGSLGTGKFIPKYILQNKI